MFYGGFCARLAAAFVDALLVACALLVFELPALFMENSGNPLYQPILFQFTPWDIFLYLLTVAYYIGFTYVAGATLGKRAFSLRVVAADGKKLSLWNVIYRETIGKYLSAAFIYAGYMVAIADREKRALHDMLADTRVVYSFGKELRMAAAAAGAGGQTVFGMNGQVGQNSVNPSQAANAYRNVEDYYRRNSETYKAADYEDKWQAEEKSEE